MQFARDALRGCRRILIIGTCGAGKSTLASALGNALDLPVIHLDHLYWRPGWVESPPDEFDAALAGVLAQDRWIIDGQYLGTLGTRVRACDAIVWLDPPRAVCIAGVVARRLRHLAGTRADMASGCPERFQLEFVRWIWRSPTRAPKIRAELERARSDGKVVIHLRSRDEAVQLTADADAPRPFAAS
jgi:adenylate kinase family enzyme